MSSLGRLGGLGGLCSGYDLSGMSEAQFQRRVIRMAKRNGWLVFHPKRARLPNGVWVTAFIGDAGFPDLVLVRPPQVIFAELKGSSGTVSPQQERWLNALRGCPVEVYVWRPEELDFIRRVLEAAPVALPRGV